jgi:alpha-tubulin suppressor-like RCC1 family protein/uncharacterized protein YjdB
MTCLRRVFGLVTAAVVVACSGASHDTTAPPTQFGVASVSVSGGASLAVGETVQLTAVAHDAKGAEVIGQAVTWATSAPSVASVSKDGLVTGIAPGAATITATILGTMGSAALNVAELTVASVSVSGGGSIALGQTVQLTATANDASGREIRGRTISWATDDGAVATVSSSGLVTGIAPGSANITATIGGKTGKAAVSIAQISVASITLESPTIAMAVRQTATIKASASDASGNPIGANFISWSTSDSAVIAVRKDGSLEALTPGNVTVTASAGGKSASASATVIAFSSISAGSGNNCALTHEGFLFCAGARSGPTVKPTWTDLRWSQVVTIEGDAQTGHGCGITSGGAVMCWGGNANGQLGVGDHVDRSSPAAVSIPEPTAQVSVGGSHSCALTSLGNIYCWGDNTWGQLGTGDAVSSSVPVRVVGSTRYVQVVAGGLHTCALDDQGRAICWGRNRNGDLGRGSWSITELFATPAPVVGNLQFKMLTVSAAHTCGLTLDGDAYCWGQNTVFELGQQILDICDGGHPCGVIPRKVFGGRTFQTLAASGFGGCGLSDDTAYCWGLDAQSALGATVPVPLCPAAGAPAGCTPTPLPGPTGFRSLTGGAVNYCGIRADGGAYCWGGNREGQLGVAGVEASAVPVVFSIDPKTILPR